MGTFMFSTISLLVVGSGQFRIKVGNKLHTTSSVERSGRADYKSYFLFLKITVGI